MKTSFYLTAFCILSLSIFLVWSKLELNNHDTSIAISEDDDTYTLKASYDRGNSQAVYNYINKNISPDRLGDSENDYFDVTTSLTDKTVFYIKESPGKLKIELNKKKNTTASYYRIKKMCEGVKGLLAGR
jgi:hypothetical protein